MKVYEPVDGRLRAVFGRKEGHLQLSQDHVNTVAVLQLTLHVAGFRGR